MIKVCPYHKKQLTVFASAYSNSTAGGFITYICPDAACYYQETIYEERRKEEDEQS